MDEFRNSEFEKRGKPNAGSSIVAIVVLVCVLAIGAASLYIFSKLNDKVEPAASSRIVISDDEDEYSDSSASPVSDISISDNSGSSDITSSQSSNKPVSVDDDYFKDAVFVGDFFSTGLELYKPIKDTNYLTIENMTTSSALNSNIKYKVGTGTVPQLLATMNPKKIYLMIGANEIKWISKSNYLSNYKNLVTEIKKKCPNAVIYIQSILPVSKQYDNNNADISNEKIIEFNTGLDSIASELSVNYLNVQSVYSDSQGYLDPVHSTNGLYIKAGSYKLWADYIKANAVDVK